MSFTLTSWTELFLRLGLGALGVFGAVLFVARFSRSGTWLRALWRSAFVAWLLLLGAEVTGVGGLLWQSLAARNPGSVVPILRRDRVAGATEATGNSSEMTYRILPEEPQGLSGGTWRPGIVWALISAMLLGRSALTRFWLMWRYRGRSEVADLLVLGRAWRVAGIFGLTRVRWVHSDTLASPIAFGVIRPTVCLPSSFASDFTAEQQEAILAHELAHLAGRDPIWYALAEVVCALWWWNPLVWVGRRRLFAASESAADEAALLLGQGPGVLAECLVLLGRRLVEAGSPAMMGMGGTGFRSALAHRVTRLLELEGNALPRVSWLQRWVIRPLVFVVVVLIGVACLGWQLTSFGNGAIHRQGWNSSLLGQSWVALRSPTSLAATASQSPRFESPPVVDPPAKENGGPSRIELINWKLDTLIVDRLACKGKSLSEVVEDLSAKTKRLDPAGVGLNFIVLPGDQVLGHIRFTFDLPLEWLTARGVLDSLLKLSPEPLDYEIESEAIVFRSGEESGRKALFTRHFQFPTNNLPLLLRSSTSQRVPAGAASTSAIPPQAEGVHQALARSGVPLHPPKQLFWKPNQGRLMVRAELKDLDLIEKLLSNPQIVIQAKFIEMPPELAEQQGVYRMMHMDPPRPVLGVISNIVPQIVPLPEQILGESVEGAEEAVHQGVLSRSEVSKLLALEGFPGVNVLSSPTVLTLSGRQAQIRAKQSKSVVVGAHRPATGTQFPITQVVEVGPQLDVIPRFFPELNQLDLRLVASLTEFIGYDKQAAASQDPDDPRPVFQLRQARRSAYLKDGESLAFCLGSDAPGVEEVALQNPSESGKRRGNRVVFVLVTATLVDAAGNRFHPDEKE